MLPLEVKFQNASESSEVKLGVRFGDYDRRDDSGNSTCFFVFVYSEIAKPDISEIRFRVGAECIAIVSTFQDFRGALSHLCPGYEDRAIYAHLCINRLILPQDTNIDVVVVSGYGERMLGVIQVSGNDTTKVVEKIDLGCNPILITSLGRSGSTVLANSLGLHPDVEVWGDYPFEYRYFSYCLHAINVLTSPANHDFSMSGDAFESRSPFSIGFNPFNCRDYDRLIGKDNVRDYFEKEVPAKTAHFFFGLFKNFIGNATRKQTAPLAFVEKVAGTQLADLANNLCLNVIEIVLIRDFWDLVNSMIAFDKKRGTSSFFSGDPNAWLESMAFQYVKLVQRSRMPGKVAVAYDDLVSAPRVSISNIAREIPLSADEEALVEMLRPFEESKYRDRHETNSLKYSNVRDIFDTSHVDRVELALDQVR